MPFRAESVPPSVIALNQVCQRRQLAFLLLLDMVQRKRKFYHQTTLLINLTMALLLGAFSFETAQKTIISLCFHSLKTL